MYSCETKKTTISKCLVSIYIQHQLMKNKEIRLFIKLATLKNRNTALHLLESIGRKKKQHKKSVVYTANIRSNILSKGSSSKRNVNGLFFLL